LFIDRDRFGLEGWEDDDEWWLTFLTTFFCLLRLFWNQIFT
jgi:hypothetical protein